MSKYTRKEIKQIIECTPKALNDKSTLDFCIEWLGYYKAPSWNWSYDVGAFIYEGRIQIAVFQFGHIVAR